jgi:hypothetical protein
MTPQAELTGAVPACQRMHIEYKHVAQRAANSIPGLAAVGKGKHMVSILDNLGMGHGFANLVGVRRAGLVPATKRGSARALVAKF